jgi:hypothetical protein
MDIWQSPNSCHNLVKNTSDDLIFRFVCELLDKLGTPLPFEGGGLTHRIVDDVLD